MNFFRNLSILRFVISLYGLQVSRSLKTRKAIKSGLQCTTFFSQILCLQVSVLIIHGHCPQLSFSRAQFSKKGEMNLIPNSKQLPISTLILQLMNSTDYHITCS